MVLALLVAHAARGGARVRRRASLLSALLFLNIEAVSNEQTASRKTAEVIRTFG